MKTPSGRRWFVVTIFFFFMLLQQSDKLLFGTLTPNIMSIFGITMTEMGAVSTGALIAGIIADRSSLHVAILAICVSTWLVCGLFFALVARVLPKDISILRGEMQARAQQERAAKPVEPQAPAGLQPAIRL